VRASGSHALECALVTLSSLGPSVGTQASAEATLVTSGSASDDAGANGGAKPRVLARGATIGRYVVLGPIGAGAMGTVVAAYDPELDRKIAIKLLHAHGDDDAATLRREAQTLARLNHPNVVTVYDVGLFGELPDRRVFLAMEFVDGTTLRRWWKAQPRSPTEIVCPGFSK